MHLTLVRLAFVYLLIGMLLGIGMGAAGDFTLRPVHAHVNLLGWAVLVVAGLLVRAYPGLEQDRLFRTFCRLYNLAMPASMVALAVMLAAVRDPHAGSALAHTMKGLSIVATLGVIASIGLLLAALGRQPRGA